VSIIKAYRFELRTRPSVRSQLRRLSGTARWVWNRALAEQRGRFARKERYAGYAEMCRWLTEWRHDGATAWLAEGPIQPQQQVLRQLDQAYKRFFSSLKAGSFAGGVGPPKFKRRGQEPGLRFPESKKFALDVANGRIKLPKLGWVRLRMSQTVEGALRNISVTREGERWFASIQVETDNAATELGVAPTLGIDVGLRQFAAMSDGGSIAPLKAMAKQQRRLKHLQRSVSRKTRGSINRRKAVAQLGALHRRIAHQRSDWLHKLTTELAERHPIIALEDLRIRNMSRSARGNAEAPGKNVRAKTGLNRGILDAAWGEFARQLTYKAEWRGGRVILVNPAFTSRTCCVCRHESRENRKTQAVFACMACGHTEDADVHAAKNILAAGHAAWARRVASATSAPAACGGVVSRSRCASSAGAAPLKQEPTEAKALA
jgi:putative transposase